MLTKQHLTNALVFLERAAEAALLKGGKEVYAWVETHQALAATVAEMDAKQVNDAADKAAKVSP